MKNCAASEMGEVKKSEFCAKNSSAAEIFGENFLRGGEKRCPRGIRQKSSGFAISA